MNTRNTLSICDKLLVGKVEVNILNFSLIIYLVKYEWKKIIDHDFTTYYNL